jgi:hypothetical protein
MAGTGTGAKSMRMQRDAIVTCSGGTSSASKTNTAVAGGSSMVLSRLAAASGSALWKRSITMTLRRPSIGDR